MLTVIEKQIECFMLEKRLTASRLSYKFHRAVAVSFE
jgi:hypothetical protein